MGRTNGAPSQRDLRENSRVLQPFQTVLPAFQRRGHDRPEITLGESVKLCLHLNGHAVGERRAGHFPLQVRARAVAPSCAPVPTELRAYFDLPMTPTAE